MLSGGFHISYFTNNHCPCITGKRVSRVGCVNEKVNIMLGNDNYWHVEWVKTLSVVEIQFKFGIHLTCTLP